MPILILIRHCEPAITGVMLGQLDPPLSQSGRMTAEAALSKVSAAVAYCSPLQRAVQSAQFVRANRIVILPELRELDYGEWTGKTWAEIETHWHELAQRKQRDWLGVTPPSGESWPQLLERASIVLSVMRKGKWPAAVVAHQGVNAALAHLADGRDPTAFRQGYGEVIRIELD